MNIIYRKNIGILQYANDMMLQLINVSISFKAGVRNTDTHRKEFRVRINMVFVFQRIQLNILV